MKKILAALMFAAVLGMLMCSVSAADLHPYDFDGKFTLDVPGDDFDRHPVGTNTFNDKSNNLKIEYFTIDEINNKNCENFDVYIDECLRLDEVESDGNMTVFKDGDDYVVTVPSDDVLVIITSNDLEKAKAVAESADFGDDKSEDPTNESSTPTNPELKSQDFHGLFKMDVPKDSDFGDTENYDKKMTTDSITYEDTINNLTIHYVDDEDFNDQVVKDTVDGLKQQGAEVSTDGNLYILSANGANEVIFHDGSKTLMIGSDQLDADTLTDMAKSIEITE